MERSVSSPERRAPAHPYCLLRDRVPALLLWGIMACLCAGCPIPMTKRTVGATGSEAKTVDLGFLQPGVTTREEVLDKLAWIDTGFKDDNAFLGRWIGSGRVWVVYGGTTRSWKERNLLLDFDESGVVRQFRVVGDDDLVKELSSWPALEAVPELLLPNTISITHRHGYSFALKDARLILGPDFFDFEEIDEDSHNFRILPQAVSRISRVGIWSRTGPEPDSVMYFLLTIHFQEKTKAGKRITISLGLPELTTLVRFFLRTNPEVFK